MDQKPTLDIVFLAVSALYNNPNASEKERASQWLNDLQKSVSNEIIIIYMSVCIRINYYHLYKFIGTCLDCS